MHLTHFSVTSLLAASLAASLPAQGSITPIPNTCPTLPLVASGNPVVGGVMGWTVDSDSTTAALGLLVVGTSGLALNGLPVPQLLDPLGPTLRSCSQLAAADVVLSMSSIELPTSCIVGGVPTICLLPQFRFVWNVPNNPLLTGASFSTQALILDSIQGPVVSTGNRITIG